MQECMDDGNYVIENTETSYKAHDDSGVVHITSTSQTPTSASGADVRPVVPHTHTHTTTTTKMVATKSTRGIQCLVCYSMWPSASALRRHMFSHSGEKLFPCLLCDDHRGGTAFSQKSNLKAHVECVHNFKKYTCDICMEEMSSKGNLSHHLDKTHSDFMVYCYECDTWMRGGMVRHKTTSKHLKGVARFQNALGVYVKQHNAKKT